eukprot:1175822-Ditylum_brightwellii.AAC.1
MLLEHYLNHVNPNIESVGEMRKTESDKRWLLVCKKVNTLKVIKFVDYTLPNIFKERIGKEDKWKDVNIQCNR